MDLPKFLNVLLGILTGLAIVIFVSGKFDHTKDEQCAPIKEDGEIIGERCTREEGPLLESVQLSPDACFDVVRAKHGDKYAAYACYPDDYISEKRPL